MQRYTQNYGIVKFVLMQPYAICSTILGHVNKIKSSCTTYKRANSFMPFNHAVSVARHIFIWSAPV